MEILSGDGRPVFGVDSKSVYKQWEQNGQQMEFKALLSVLVNPTDDSAFEAAYDQALQEAFERHGLERERLVYKSYDIGSLLTGNPDAQEACIKQIADALIQSRTCKITFVYTHINAKALSSGDHRDKDGSVTVYGQYGSGARHISSRAFTDMVEPYHCVLAAWRVMKNMGLKNARVLLDGVDGLRDCYAWQTLTEHHNVEIYFRGDQTIPEISAADLLARAALDAARRARSYVNEDRIRELLDPGGIHDHIYYCYLGNPNIHEMRPLSDAPISLGHLKDYIAHPIVFVSGGNVQGIKDIFEGTQAHNQALKSAAGMRGGVKFFDGKKDRMLIGQGPTEDYFMALNDPARAQLDALKATGRKVKELKPPGSP